jgi:hypothetical protein
MYRLPYLVLKAADSLKANGEIQPYYANPLFWVGVLLAIGSMSGVIHTLYKIKKKE